MTTQEFIDEFARKGDWGLGKGKLQEIVSAALDFMDEKVIAHKEVRLGKHYFKLVTRKARNIRNPRTGEMVSIPERSFIFYKKRVH